MFLCFLLVTSGLLPLDASVQPNFVFILTDDQDLVLNGLIPMQKTLKLVANEGKTFTNAFVNSPICCPSRSTILTGKYAHNTGVLNNSISGNCSSRNWQYFHEPFSISSLLKSVKNYKTFYAGKYLNEYGSKSSGGTKHIPPGYDWWIGLKGNSKYYNYTLSINGSATYYENEYLTDILAKHALDFLNQNYVAREPFFMTIAPPASHAPFTPAPRHKNRFPEVTAVRSPSFNFTSVDKHWIVQMPPNRLPADVTILDDIQKKRLQSLLAVDEMVGSLIQKLKDLKILENTYVLFTSDNGFHIGQFTQPWDKRQPYQTDIKVPFIISGPKVPKKNVDTFPISAVDIAPTILDLAQVKIPKNMDGSSFKQQLEQKSDDGKKNNRKFVLIEYWGEGGNGVDPSCPWNFDNDVSECAKNSWCKCQDSKNNTYNCVLEISATKSLKFCKFYEAKEFIEFYNLNKDPYELKNEHHSMVMKQFQRFSNVLEKLKKCSGQQCILNM